MLDVIGEMVKRRDRCIRWMNKIAREVPVTAPLMRDLELTLTTPAPEVQVVSIDPNDNVLLQESPVT